MTFEPANLKILAAQRDGYLHAVLAISGWDAELQRLSYLQQAVAAQRKLVAAKDAWKETLAPCRTCGRKVPSPCHDPEGYLEGGPWDLSCRDFIAGRI